MPRRMLQPRPLGLAPEDDGDRIESLPPERAVRWGLLLVWFMRLLALAWIVKGLGSWATILGVGGASPPFEARSLGFQATVIFFAGLDLVAAVGLWMTSTWGGVLWLLAVMSNLILAVFFPQIVPSGPVTIGLFLICIIVYLAVSWLAANGE